MGGGLWGRQSLWKSKSSVAVQVVSYPLPQSTRRTQSSGYGRLRVLPDMRQTECLRLFLVSFVPFVVGNMNGLNAYVFLTAKIAAVAGLGGNIILARD